MGQCLGQGYVHREREGGKGGGERERGEREREKGERETDQITIGQTVINVT